jgi:hypothetical protein
MTEKPPEDDGRLNTDALTSDEQPIFMDAVQEIGRVMMAVFERRNGAAFDYDGYCLFFNDDTGKTARMHMHICLQEGDAADAAMVTAAHDKTPDTPSTLQ